VADVGETFELAGAGGGDHYVLARRDPVARLRDECGDVSVIARGRLSVQSASCACAVSVVARRPGAARDSASSTARCSIARRGAICNARFHSSSSKINLVGRLSQRIFDCIERLRQLCAIFFNRSSQQRRLVQDDQRLNREIKQR